MRDSITNTWDGVTRVNFTGWGQCATSSKGIRIRIADTSAAPATKVLGRALDGVLDGMSLNFTFKNWNKLCGTDPSLTIESCVKSVAVHEFGHALGFAHEQNRSDTATQCSLRRQGPDGNLLAGSWDTNSIMNYCNPQYNNNGRLSAGDIKYSRQLYGDPTQTTARRAALDWGNGKVYFFNKSEYTRYNLSADRVDDYFPKAISGNWAGWPAAWASGIDAAVNWGNGSAYLFRDGQALIYSITSDRVTSAPASISARISGWPASWTSVDDALSSTAPSGGNYWDKKVYFFRGSQYLRVNVDTKKVDLSPRSITSGWPGVWTSGINYTLVVGPKAYFFKRTEYERFQLSNTAALDPRKFWIRQETSTCHARLSCSTTRCAPATLPTRIAHATPIVVATAHSIRPRTSSASPILS